MDNEECRKALLNRVLKVNPCTAEAILCHIATALTPKEIEEYVNGSDEGIQTLIDETKESMKPKARSPARQFPVPSSNSQGQSSNTFEGIQAAPVGQIGTSQLPGSSSNPDDGMREIQDPFWDSQGQSRGTCEGIEVAPSGQNVTSQVPADKSIGLEENSHSSSFPGDGVPECSDVTGCPPSSSRQWPETCRFYMSRRGLCKKGLSCDFSHGFGSSGQLEMEIRELLLRIPCAAVLVEDLPWKYFERYNKRLPLGSVRSAYDWNLRSLPSLLRSLHTICWVPGSYGQHFLVLLEHYQAYTGYSAHLQDWKVLKDEGPNQIYIDFSVASRSIFTRRDVYHYFCQYGPVLSVNIPHQRSFGFVRFQYPETTRLLLSEWNPQVPHFIFGEAVHVCRCIPKGEAKLKNSAGKHGLENGCDRGIVTAKSSGTSAPEVAPPLTNNQPSHSQMEIGPLEGGDATGSPNGDPADHSQPSHSQVEINPSEAGQVPDGLEINPVEAELVPGGLGGVVADEQIDNEIGACLPDAGCFYKQT